MNQTPNFELFYDVLDESLLALYEIKHDRFFNLLLRTGRNIVAGEVLDKEATPEQKDNLVKFYEKLDGIDFNVEEIRKAFQMMILRGFKEENMKNGEVTPDTLGIFIGYLINKLAPNSKKLSILDPVVGTGNLLYSVANHLECELKLYGVDNIYEVLELATILGDLLNYDIEMFNQDTLTHPFSQMDFVIADLPDYHATDYDNKYFPYLCVIEHLASLKDDGYMICLAPNNFFDHDKDNFFKDHLKASGSSVLGVLELPNNMFKANPKSIIIFSKKALESKNCLLVSLPSFSSASELNKALIKIEDWFLQQEINKEKK